MREVRIFYTRPPRAPDIFQQPLVHEGPDVLVSLTLDLDLPEPKVIDGWTAMEPGSSIVWFTYPGRWYDIGKTYLRDGTFSGVYANILTPVRIEPIDVWHTTDLFLDVWIGPSGEPQLLDEDALESAVLAGDIGPETAQRARNEAAALLEGTGAGTWPPPEVDAWDLARALEIVG